MHWSWVFLALTPRYGFYEISHVKMSNPPHQKKKKKKTKIKPDQTKLNRCRTLSAHQNTLYSFTCYTHIFHPFNLTAHIICKTNMQQSCNNQIFLHKNIIFSAVKILLFDKCSTFTDYFSHKQHPFSIWEEIDTWVNHIRKTHLAYHIKTTHKWPMTMARHCYWCLNIYYTMADMSMMKRSG